MQDERDARSTLRARDLRVIASVGFHVHSEL
jgi:hypothetical protein